MDPLMLSRIQFASTTIFHFIFVPITIGLVFLIAIMETLYVFKGDEMYKKMAKFWGKLFLINFAVGVVTGILQEFQFGMNWSSYSRFVGDVFGAPLAVEALLAFFLESTFIGLWIFGWDRLPKKLHLLSIWLVSFGTIMSAFWILTANAFMQNPVGYEIVNGRAQMNDFFALISNPKLWTEFPHVILGSFATGAFLVLGVSAWKLLKKQDIEFFKKSFHLGLILAFISSIGIAITGHAQAQLLVDIQPMKLAAAEAVWEDSGDPAPWKVFATIDTEKQENGVGLEIPYLLSYFSFGEFSGEVEGMKTLQERYEQQYGDGNYIPPVKTTFWNFRIMIISGGIMIAIALYAAYLSWRNKLLGSPIFLKFLVAAISLPFIANTTGWIMAEIGRQPWTVFGLMQTAAGVSPNVSAGQILFSIITFCVLYTILAIIMAYLFVREIKKGPEGEQVAVEPRFDPFDGKGYESIVK